MDKAARVIAASSDLEEGGGGIRFTVEQEGEAREAFAIRYDGQVHAYLNQCAHVPIELDWMEGQFFDDQGLYLVCSTHGALYEPDSGYCVGGPCAGKRLVKLAVVEENGQILYRD